MKDTSLDRNEMFADYSVNIYILVTVLVPHSQLLSLRSKTIPFNSVMDIQEKLKSNPRIQ